MSRLWAGYVGQLGRRLKINSTHSTKASESSSQNKQTNVTIIMCRCPCLTQKQNATVGVGRQCLTLGRAGLTVATDSDVCRPMWIILCGHFSQMSPLAKQSVRNQNWCLAHNLYLFLPFTAFLGKWVYSDMGRSPQICTAHKNWCQNLLAGIHWPQWVIWLVLVPQLMKRNMVTLIWNFPNCYGTFKNILSHCSKQVWALHGSSSISEGV